VADSSPASRIALRRDAQQWVYDWVVKETGKVFHFQPDGRGPLPPSVRSHAMIAKHLGQMAARVEKVAIEEAAVGHDETALDWYFDAATLYAEAQHTVLVPSEEKRFLHGASLRCYDEVRARAPYTIEHLDIGQGEVDWELFFGTLERLEFDGIMTACVFGWEERAHESSRFMRAEMERYTRTWKHLERPLAASGNARVRR
jgi:hypothetical protein